MRQSEQASPLLFPPAFVSEYGPRIGAEGVGIALILLFRADSYGFSRASYRLFMHDLSLTQYRVKKALFALESCGIVSIERRHEAGHNAELRFWLREPLFQPKISRLDARRGRAAAAR